VEQPLQRVRETNGLVDEKVEGTNRSNEQIEAMDKALGQERSSEVAIATPGSNIQWSTYDNDSII
jgi:Mn-containing catalase